jgi:hypothetical protein
MKTVFCALLLWLVNCWAASVFDCHGLRMEATRISFRIDKRFWFCRGFYRNTASYILQIISLLDRHLLCWFPSKLCYKHPIHPNHMSACGSLLCALDTALSARVVLAPLVAKFRYSCTTFSKINNMI